MKMNKKTFNILCCSVAGVVMGSALVYFNFIDKAVPPVEIGSMCPQFSVNTFLLNKEEGKFEMHDKKATNLDYEGKVLVINFWSMTCGACMEEMPYFDQFQKAYKEDVVVLALDGEKGASYEYVCNEFMNKRRTTKGMEVYGVDGKEGTTDDGIVEEIYRWETFDITFGHYKVPGNDVGVLLGFSGSWPSTMIVDRDGFIQYSHTGGMTYADLEEQVKPLL